MRLDRRSAAALFTALALAAGFTVAVRRDRPNGAASEDEPRDVFWQMVEASRDGDVDSYLDAFTGDLASQLQTNREEMGDSGFATYLQQRFSELKGVAVTGEENLGDFIRLRVEYVYASTYEAQDLELRESRGRWRIARTGTTRRQESQIPYGTPIGPND